MTLLLRGRDNFAMKQYLEAGKIVNTHGIRGEVKIDPWTDSPGVFTSLKRIYIDGREVAVRSSYVHGRMVIASLDGVDGIDGAIALKNKIVMLDRADLSLPAGTFFVQDIIGLNAIDDATGEKFGIIKDVIPMPSGNVYEIAGADGRDILVPAVSDFIISTDLNAGTVRIRLIEGM